MPAHDPKLRVTGKFLMHSTGSIIPSILAQFSRNMPGTPSKTFFLESVDLSNSQAHTLWKSQSLVGEWKLQDLYHCIDPPSNSRFLNSIIFHYRDRILNRCDMERIKHGFISLMIHLHVAIHSWRRKEAGIFIEMIMDTWIHVLNLNRCWMLVLIRDMLECIYRHLNNQQNL